MIPLTSNFLKPRNTNTDSGLPATTFYHFPKLPIELRFKIWDYAALHARFIEIERGPKVRNGYDLEGDICAGEDYRRRASPISRRPPAIFHVSQEARSEAKKNYQLRTFDTLTPNQTEQYIYYNPDSDILNSARNAASALCCSPSPENWWCVSKAHGADERLCDHRSSRELSRRGS